MRSIFGKLLLCICIFSNCKTVQKTQYNVADGKVEWIFLHLNDVYEIAPLSSGGGLARVATLRKQLLNENPNTFTVMAGDFLNPSVIGTLKHAGESIKGKQMVEVMNAMGIDFVSFGNHEFDLDYPDLQKRIDESRFEWIASNAFQTEGEGIRAFSRSQNPEESYFPEYRILQLKDGDVNEKVRVGIWSVVLDVNKRDFVQYSDVFERSNSLIEDVLKREADVFVGLTHLMVENDKEIAEKNPTVSLIMGGHEHNNMLYKVGNTIVAKADANAITVWVHRCSYDVVSKKTTIRSQLVKVDNKITEDPTVAAVVKKWTDIADDAYKKAGFNPADVVTMLKTPLDGRSAIVRLGQAELGHLIAQAMGKAAKKTVDCAFFNAGSIRIDDLISGKVTQQDIVRVLPFGGKLVECDIEGKELKKVLLAGLNNKGKGGYLQWDKIAFDNVAKTFTINNLPLDEQKKYHVITTDFLISGKENNLDFFVETNPSVSNLEKPTDKADLRSDIRQAFIDFLKKR